MSEFVPAADEVTRLQRGRDPDCQFFQKFAENGHYGGSPGTTRQGTYAATPSGMLLAAANSNDPERIASLMKSALARWKSLSREERLLASDPQATTTQIRRPESRYPEDGLVLKVNSRDLPREKPTTDRWATAWNQDFLWYTREEARGFLPETPAVGQKHEVPATLIQRIARTSLVDNVRGQTRPFDESHVKLARMTAEIRAVEGDVVTLRLEGETKTEAQGAWPINDRWDQANPTRQKRGFDMRLLGSAKYDMKAQRFTAFEMVALGTRFGGTQYNGRRDDLEPNPIGIAFTVADGSSTERVAPAYLTSYGWQ
jgi:hypothetical protein